jgi:hypothetical protein
VKFIEIMRPLDGWFASSKKIDLICDTFFSCPHLYLIWSDWIRWEVEGGEKTTHCVLSCTAELHLSGSPIVRIGFALWGKYVENSIKLTCLAVTGYMIKYSIVLWLLKLQISRGRKVQTQVHTAELQTASLAYFQIKILLSGFSVYLDVSLSQIIRISVVILYLLRHAI